MVTSEYEWKILECDEKPQTNKRKPETIWICFIVHDVAQKFFFKKDVLFYLRNFCDFDILFHLANI